MVEVPSTIFPSSTYPITIPFIANHRHVLLNRNAASKLDKLINRWAADIVQNPPVPIDELYRAVASDLNMEDGEETTPMVLQHLLRHAMSETISEGVVNCLMVTNSGEANVQLTRLHEHLFARKCNPSPSLHGLSCSITIRGPNGSLRLAATNLFGSRRSLHPRDVYQYSH
jgi:hypothetical protein